MQYLSNHHATYLVNQHQDDISEVKITLIPICITYAICFIKTGERELSVCTTCWVWIGQWENGDLQGEPSTEDHPRRGRREEPAKRKTLWTFQGWIPAEPFKANPLRRNTQEGRAWRIFPRRLIQCDVSYRTIRIWSKNWCDFRLSESSTYTPASPSSSGHQN